MFPYKSNAFHAYETRRNPLKSRYFVYLLAIAALLGVLVFTEARAEQVGSEACEAIKKDAYTTIRLLKAALNKPLLELPYEQMTIASEFIDSSRKAAAEYATIINTFCKD